MEQAVSREGKALASLFINDMYLVPWEDSLYSLHSCAQTVPRTTLKSLVRRLGLLWSLLERSYSRPLSRALSTQPYYSFPLGRLGDVFYHLESHACFFPFLCLDSKCWICLRSLVSWKKCSEDLRHLLLREETNAEDWCSVGSVSSLPPGLPTCILSFHNEVQE